jgi:phenylalanyl-tRNA synthetase beta chain
LTNIRDNFNRNIFDLKIFEVSRTFIDSKDKLPFEPVKIGVAIAGRDNRTLWNAKPENYDFYDLKGIVDKFLENNGLKKAELRRSSHPAFHPGRSADICAGKDVIGTFGEIHPDVLENMGIEERAYIAEIDMAKLIKYSKNKIDYKRVVKYPAVGRDFAIVLPEDVLVGNMLKEMEKISNLVESVELFDIYRGEKVGENLKSAAVNLLFRADDRTLGEEEINGLTESILKMVETKFGGKLRS